MVFEKVIARDICSCFAIVVVWNMQKRKGNYSMNWKERSNHGFVNYFFALGIREVGMFYLFWMEECLEETH